MPSQIWRVQLKLESSLFTPIKKEKKKIRASGHQNTQASGPMHHRKGSLQR
jgi:hypothetical protein